VSHVRLFSLLLLTTALGGCAWRQSIAGSIVDRNGAPLPRANVVLHPGNIELVTDDEGRFLIDYVRGNDENVRRERLQPQQAYTVEVFKVGYHVRTVDFYYSRGAATVDPIQLTEETIAVRDDEVDLDVGLYTNPTHSSGATYEGQ
jgi:hypothetical protein